MQNKNPIQQLIEQENSRSPAKDLSIQQQANKITGEMRKGQSRDDDVWNKGKTGVQTAWNKGKTGVWGNTRKERGLQMSDQERRAYFGTVEEHTEETIAKMSASAEQRWAKQMKCVHADGVEYKNIYEASNLLGVHKDTIVYRIKAKGAKWVNWYFINNEI